MSQFLPTIFQAHSVNSLDTYVHTALAASPYTIHVHAEEIPPSGLIITIEQNSTVIATSSVPAASQNHVELSALIMASINDSLKVILSSSVASDAGLNTCKAVISISQGLIA